MEKEKSGAENVRAVERALDILGAFGPGDSELSVGELLKRVDLSRATLYRLLYTLEEMGFLRSEGDPQRFRLGPAVGRLAWAWSASQHLAQRAMPIMQAVWDQTGETVALFAPQDRMRICVAELPSPHPLSFKRGVGYSERIVRGASGRALLAWQDLKTADLQRLCEGESVTPSQLQAQLEHVRQQGYAVSQDELIAGAAAVAVPFFDNSNRVAGSMAVFGPMVRLNDQRIDEIAQLLQGASKDLTLSLGGRAPALP